MINLPYTIGSRIRDSLDMLYRKNLAKEPEEIKKLYPGRKSEVFDESELDLVDELHVDIDTLEYLDLFKNVKKLYFDLNSSITDIQLILENYPKLEKLTIAGQRGLRCIDLSKNPRLRELSIYSNPDWDKIIGIDKLDNLKEFTFYNNIIYHYNNDILHSAIRLASNYSRMNLDVLLYPKLIEKLDKLNIDDDVRRGLLSRFNWSEEINVGGLDNKITYHSSNMEKMYQIACELKEKYIKDTDTDIQKYAIIYQWMCENIKYSYDSHGLTGGTNGTFNALAYRECVCQGYSKAMQFLLNTVGIHAEDVPCMTDRKHQDIKQVIINGERRPEVGDHSILRILINGQYYYSDVTWDAIKYKNNRDRKYFLLSINDMQKDHKMKDTFGMVFAINSISQDDFNELMRFAKNRISGLDNMINYNENSSGEDTKIL